MDTCTLYVHTYMYMYKYLHVQNFSSVLQTINVVMIKIYFESIDIL